MGRCFGSSFRLILLFFVSAVVGGKAARESYQRTSEILRTLERIEEKLNKEERIREITGLVHLEATLDRISSKLDRVLDILDAGNGGSSSASPRISDSTAVSEIPRDLAGRLQSIDENLRKLEKSTTKMEGAVAEVDFRKLDDVDKGLSKLQTDLNQKLRKMMNIITALYEMNKEIKTNFGGRSETPSTQAQTQPSYAAEFLVENLEELERKIKEQFSVLTNEVRSEITGLKILASGIGNCDKGADSEYDSVIFDDGGATTSDKRSSRREAALRDSRNVPSRRSSTSGNATLDTIVESLGRTTREIREEIHQGIETLDHKISNLTQMQARCNDLEPSSSVVSPVRVSREFDPSNSVQDVEAKSASKGDSCSKTAKNLPSPGSCAELRIGGATCDGVYVIFPKKVRAVRVLCDMTTDGGGWTVLMRRGDYGDKMTSFHKNWLSYKNGFGDVEGEFWLGNDVINLLSTQDDNILRVRLEAFDGESINFTYTSFSIADEAGNYRLQIGPSAGPSTPASNGLRYHNNHPFSTFDRKNDAFEQNCAATYKGGWWFNGCYFGFLTGEYFRPDDKREGWQGMLWYDWKGNAPLKAASMMIRPKNFRP